MRLSREFYRQGAVELAPKLLGMCICRCIGERIVRFRIIETEAYRGEDDTACHAYRGKTKRTEIMYNTGGYAYVYLCYGIHHMLNIVSGEKNFPEAVLIRGGIVVSNTVISNNRGVNDEVFNHSSIETFNNLEEGKVFDGPGKLTKALFIDKTLNAEDLVKSEKLWLESDGYKCNYNSSKRIGIDYADERDRNRLWRFTIE